MVDVLEGHAIGGEALPLDHRLCLRHLPRQPIVAQQEANARDVAVEDEGADLLDTGLQARIEVDLGLEVEEEPRGIDGLRDPVLREIRTPVEVGVLVLP